MVKLALRCSHNFHGAEMKGFLRDKLKGSEELLFDYKDWNCFYYVDDFNMIKCCKDCPKGYSSAISLGGAEQILHNLIVGGFTKVQREEPLLKPRFNPIEGCIVPEEVAKVTTQRTVTVDNSGPVVYNNPLENTTVVETPPTMRTFTTGATRNIEEGKLDYEGFLSPLVLKQFAEYMDSHRLQADGQLRDSDNWQKGMPIDVYMKSMWRHFFDVWSNHRGIETPENEITNLCALMFNVQGMMYELLKRNANE